MSTKMPMPTATATSAATSRTTMTRRDVGGDGAVVGMGAAGVGGVPVGALDHIGSSVPPGLSVGFVSGAGAGRAAGAAGGGAG
jgi:hypothetical protein